MTPCRIAALLCAAACLFPSPASAGDALRSRLDALSADYAAIGVNAVVLVGNRDGVLYETAFGQADLAAKRPLDVATRFKTESVGKLFTSTRVMQLVEQGRLSLDDGVAQYLPGWAIADLDRMTVHQLLTHTAGLASMWDHPDYDFSRSYTPAELKAIIEAVPPVRPPGGAYYYSNSGYYLLGQVIEAVTGESFDDDLRRHVFEAAGMDGIGHLGAVAMPPDAAQPYIHFSSRHWRPHAMGVSPRANPAGGWVATARDLHAFARHYLAGGFIGEPAMHTQWTANATVDLQEPGNHYGYGTEVFVDTYVPGRTIVGHSGGGGGFSVDLFMEPVTGTVVVVMANMHGMNREMSGNYLRAALGLPVAPAMHSRTVRTVDHLLRKGLAYFRHDPARFFAEIRVPKYSAGFLGQVAGFLDEIERPDLARGVEEVSRALHDAAPAEG